MLAKLPLPPKISTPAIVIGAFLTLLAGFAAQLGHSLHVERNTAIQDAEDHAQILAHTLEEHVSRTVEAADAELRATSLRFQIAADPNALNRELRQRLAELPALSLLAIANRDGIVVNQSDTPVSRGTDVSDREYFRWQRNLSAHGLYIGAPVARRSAGRIIIPMSRRITNANGEFLGVALASLNPSYLSHFVRDIPTGDHGAITVYLESGIVLARSSQGADPFGQDHSRDALFTEHLPHAASGLYRLPASGSDSARIVAYRSVNRQPFIVSVALSMDDVLGPWQRRATESIATLAIGVLGCAVMAIFLYRFFRQRDAAVESLRASETHLRAVINNTADGILTLGENGRIESLNRGAELMFGYAAEQLQGEPIEKILTSATSFPSGQTVGGTLLIAPLASSSQEMVGRRRNNATFSAELRLNTMRVGTERKYNLMVRDITERIRSEEQLRQSQRLQAVGQLTGGIAHEFNNLLMVIMGGAELLAMRLADNPKALAIAQRIETASKRGAELTRGLLAFSRRQSLQPKSIEINALLSERLKLAATTLGETIQLNVRLGDGVWMVTADPVQLNSAILNLIINARDAMPQGGSITVETANLVVGKTGATADLAPGRYVAVVMRDSGPGMKPEVLRQAFEPFFTTKEVGKGTGLGLSMVLGFARQSGGDARLASIYGKGTTATLLLPAGDQAASAGTAEETIKTCTRQASVLLAEDDPEVLATTADALRALGYHVLTAEDGPAALAVLEAADNLHLLLTDVVMPKGMSGLDLARRVQAKRPDVKIVYTSGYNEDLVVHHDVLESGVTLLRKPYTLAELAATVDGALSCEAGVRQA